MCEPSPIQLYTETKTKEAFDRLSLLQQDGIMCWALEENDVEYVKRFYHTAHFLKTAVRLPVHPIKYYENDAGNEAVKVCRRYCEKFKEVRRCIDNNEDLENVYDKEYDSKLLMQTENVLINFVDYACIEKRWKAVEQLLEMNAQPRAGSISWLLCSNGEKSYRYVQNTV